MSGSNGLSSLSLREADLLNASALPVGMNKMVEIWNSTQMEKISNDWLRRNVIFQPYYGDGEIKMESRGALPAGRQ